MNYCRCQKTCITLGYAKIMINQECLFLDFVFLGIFMGFSSIGPAIGYLGGGQILNIYVDFYRQGQGFV